MTLVALTQEPEVKVRLAMIGKWCLASCVMHVERHEGYGDFDTYCQLYDARLDYDGRVAAPNAQYLRCPACIAAHGGAE